MTYSTRFIGKNVKVTIDRPIESKHPRYDFVYNVNYGFIEGVKAPDGEFLDAYVLGVDKPIKEFNGKCIAVIHRTNDSDDKLIVANQDYSDDEIIKETSFQEKFFEIIILRK